MNDNEIFTEAGEATIEGDVSTLDLRSELDSANKKADDNWNKYLLAMADFENYKKQMEKRIHDVISGHRKSVLSRFLPVIDNLERALQFNTSGDDKLRDGKRAIEYATRACELTDWKMVVYLDTLAAAYAEAGQFDEAIRFEKKVLADPAFDARLNPEAKRRVELYLQKKPSRD